MEYICSCPSPLGPITLAGAGDVLTGLWFAGQKYFGATLSPAHGEGHIPAFDQARQWLDIYFQGRDPGFTPPLAPRGSPFRRAVWDLLLRIPYGETVTYGDLAGTLGSSPRAVGGAVGHNPISLLIPCHRVVGAEGLAGYAGGVDKKAYLLALEKSRT